MFTHEAERSRDLYFPLFFETEVFLRSPAVAYTVNVVISRK